MPPDGSGQGPRALEDQRAALLYIDYDAVGFHHGEVLPRVLYGELMRALRAQAFAAPAARNAGVREGDDLRAEER